MSKALRTLPKTWKGQTSPAYLELDLGTQGLTAAVRNALSLEVLGLVTVEYPTYLTDPDRHVKQDAREWRMAVVEAAHQLSQRGAFEKATVVAVGISGQMHAVVKLRAGQILDLSSLWNCPRAQEEGRALTAALGVKVDGRLSISHIAWEYNHGKKPWTRADMLTTGGGLLGFDLTGQHGLGLGEYSGLGIGDPQSGELSLARLKLAVGGDLEAAKQIVAIAPARISPGQVLGIMTSEAANRLQLPVHGKVVVAAPEGDQPAGTIGLGITRPGFASLMLGTSGVLNLIRTGTFEDPTLTVDFFKDAFGNDLAMGLIVNCMEQLDAVRDKYLPRHDGDEDRTWAWLDELAQSVPVDCHGSFSMQLKRAESFLGLPAGFTFEHKMPAEDNPGLEWCAAMCSVAILLRKRLKVLAAGGKLPEELRVGGGGCNNRLFMQRLSDCLGIPLRKLPWADEASAVGAGCLAVLAEEAYHGNLRVSPAEFVESLCDTSSSELWTPQPDAQAAYDYMEAMFDRHLASLK